MHRFTNYEIEIFIDEGKSLWKLFGWLSSYDILFSKQNLKSLNQKKSIYRNFKQYDSDQFKLDIFNSMSAVRAHAVYKNNFVSILDKHSPKKTKNLQGNQKPHFSKNLRKQIMIRSDLKNKANKS